MQEPDLPLASCLISQSIWVQSVMDGRDIPQDLAELVASVNKVIGLVGRGKLLPDAVHNKDEVCTWRVVIIVLDL